MGGITFPCNLSTTGNNCSEWPKLFMMRSRHGHAFHHLQDSHCILPKKPNVHHGENSKNSCTHPVHPPPGLSTRAATPITALAQQAGKPRSVHVVCRCVFASFEFSVLSLSALFAVLWVCLLVLRQDIAFIAKKQFVYFACIFRRRGMKTARKLPWTRDLHSMRQVRNTCVQEKF